MSEHDPYTAPWGIIDNHLPPLDADAIRRERRRHHPITSTQRNGPPVTVDNPPLTTCANLNCRELWPCTTARLCDFWEGQQPADAAGEGVR